VKLKAHIFPDADTAARQAAAFIAARARESVARRGVFLLAVSGGKTPAAMFRRLAAENPPWSGIRIVQVDERIAPPGDADRNLTSLEENLLNHAPPDLRCIYPMPVNAEDLSAAAQAYGETLRRLGGSPPVFDLVHLGLGADGHTASLLPGDPVLEVRDRDVAITGFYERRRRMTLTYPFIERSRHVLWLVTGSGKAQMLARLCEGDTAIPAGRIKRKNAIVFADSPAGLQMP
jgi:6-phosphogluconolactonase